VKLEVTTLAGETRTVTVGLADKVAWEAYARKAGFPLTPRVTNAGTDRQDVDVSVFPIDTWHAYLAWSGDTRSLAKRPTFADWLEDIESIVDQKLEPEADPTRRDPGPA